MKKSITFINGLTLLLLLCLCANSLAAEDRITALGKHISALEEQKGKLETEEQKLINEGDKLSYKIESLKIQARGGLGIIGKYRLSRKLRKAQSLSGKLQNIEKRIHEIAGELKGKKAELEKEYENEIAILLENLSGISGAEEKGKILEKIKEYQTAKEQLARQEKKELKPLDIAKIEIEEYDGPQEIREKADLINDFAGKLDDRIEMLNGTIKKLGDELRTRKRLGEFAEEISFFGERISKEEIAGLPEGDSDGRSADEPIEGRAVLETGAITENMDAKQPIMTTEQLPTETIRSSASSSRIMVEKNGVSANFVGISLEQIEEKIKLLEKRNQELRKELTVLSKKAGSFHKKADEIEKSETKKGGEKR